MGGLLDISPVAGHLTHLTWLDACGQRPQPRAAISRTSGATISPVAGLTPSDRQLAGSWTTTRYRTSRLWRDGSKYGTGLGSGDTVNVRENPLSYPSIHTHIPTLTGRGVAVEFDNRTPTTLLKISGAVTVSDNLLVVEVRDSQSLPFEGVAVTFTVTSGGGTLSATSTTTNANGRAESRLTLGPDAGTNTVSVSATGIQEAVTFNDTVAVNIPDPNLRAAIETALGKASGATITAAEMATLTRLSASDANIRVLTGLEFATNLTYLYLDGNSLLDISPVAGLTNLTSLHLRGNSISDISPVAGLTNLTRLELGDRYGGRNPISDISPVARLTNLTYLYLRGNPISDISPVAGLTNLTELHLRGNSLSDISPVAGLTHLTYLNLGGNSLSDISPLVANTGLGGGDTVNVKGNSLSYPSIHTHLPTLTGRGVAVEFDNRTPQTLEIVLGNDQRGSIHTALANPFVVKVTDQDSEAFEGVAVTFTITSGSGTLSATRTTTDANGRAESRLTLGPDAGTNTVSVSATGIQEAVTFNDAVAGDAVNIPDPNLRAAIETALGKASGATITAAEMATLTEFSAPNSNIRVLAGLEFATHLTVLDLGFNSVSDISPVAGLTNLTSLNLGARNLGNSLSDISPVAGLTNLTRLYLHRNSLSDISPVAGLTNLTVLDLYGTSLSDISPVAGLTNLTSLNLRRNSILDISPVAGLTNLTSLNLDGNSISDTSPVAGLTNLTVLNLDGNSILDISPVAGLTNLTYLYLDDNSILDISPVAGLTNLTYLDLDGNSLSDISPVAGLTNLTSLDLDGNSLSDISPVVGLTNLTYAGSSPQLAIGHLACGGLNQSDTAVSLAKLDMGHLACGGINQSDIAGSWRHLDMGHLACGGLNQSDIPVS